MFKNREKVPWAVYILLAIALRNTRPLLDPHLLFMVYKELRIQMEFTALSIMTTIMDCFEPPLISDSSNSPLP
jgi:hypothetical protein